MGLDITFRFIKKTLDQKNDQIKEQLKNNPPLLDYFEDLLNRIGVAYSYDKIRFRNTWDLVRLWNLENCEDKKLSYEDVDFAIQELSQEQEKEEELSKAVERSETIDELNYLLKNFNWQENILLVNAWW